MMKEEKKEGSRIKTVIRLIPVLLFLAYIFCMMVLNVTVEEVRTAVAETEPSVEGFYELSDDFEGVLAENCYDKYTYINMNGLTARALGLNTLNKRQKMTNGQLSFFNGANSNRDKLAENAIQLNDFLEERGIEFVYLLMPGKNAFYEADFSPGYSSNEAENIKTLIPALSDAGVCTINMNDWFEENEWTMDDVFYKTDHHWRASAALSAAGLVMEHLSGEGISDYKEEWLQEENYTITTLDDWFLGSHGKRVGIYYAGTDDFDVYRPNFETDYDYSGLNKRSTDWDYHDNILDESLLTERDYFNSDTYAAYMYKDFPMRRTINKDGYNKQRVLIMGDSFKMPFEYFLSTEYEEIYTVDLRYYKEGTLVQYVADIEPDIVIMCSCSKINEKWYKYGTKEYLSALKATPEDDSGTLKLGKAKVKAKEDDSENYTEITTELEPDQAYTLTVDATAYSGGEDEYVQMSLVNLSTGQKVCNRFFDANSDKTQRWVFNTPEDEGDSFAIYLYAGTKGHTEGAAAAASNIILYQGIVEDW